MLFYFPFILESVFNFPALYFYSYLPFVSLGSFIFCLLFHCCLSVPSFMCYYIRFAYFSLLLPFILFSYHIFKPPVSTTKTQKMIFTCVNWSFFLSFFILIPQYKFVFYTPNCQNSITIYNFSSTFYSKLEDESHSKLSDSKFELTKSPGDLCAHLVLEVQIKRPLSFSTFSFGKKNNDNLSKNVIMETLKL